MQIETIPALTRATVADYVELFGRSFAGDAKLSAEYLKWQYTENPDGAVIGMDAFDGEVLAAHYAIIPRCFVLSGETRMGALSVNTATHPDYQGRGLFTKLADATYEAALSRGVDFVLGVANANSVGGFVRKLGFSDLGAVRLALGALPALEGGALTTRRSATWWKWRLSNPSRAYRVAGRGGRAVLQTAVRGVRFNLGLPPREVQELQLGRNSGLSARLGLTPMFPVRGTRLLVPARLQPSPWRVILRTLQSTPVSSLADEIQIWGIDMDTF